MKQSMAVLVLGLGLGLAGCDGGGGPADDVVEDDRVTADTGPDEPGADMPADPDAPDAADTETDEAPAGISWSLEDPPEKNTDRALPCCQAAEDTFMAVLTYYRDTAAPVGDLNTLYHMERLFHGMTGVYEVTGDEEIVSNLLDISLQVIGAGEDLDGDGCLDYCFRDADGTVNGECDSEDGVMPTYPWRAMRGLARTLKAVRNSSLYESRSGDFEALRDFLWTDVIDKWLDLDGDGPDAGLRGSDTAGILSRMAGILLDYYYATGNAAAGQLAGEWISRISTDMEPSTAVEGAYVFDNWVRDAPLGEPADTSHSNEIVVALIEGFEAGLLTYAFIEPLHGTLLEVMWNGDAASPQFSEFVDGTGGLFPAQVVMGWMRLGQFKRETQQVSEAVDYSTSYDLETIEANGNLCRIFGLALTDYPLPPPDGD